MELDSHENIGEIKSREVELDSHNRMFVWLVGRLVVVVLLLFCLFVLLVFVCLFFVSLQSCSSTVASRTLSLLPSSAQLLKQQTAKYASCFALAGSPPP